MGASVSSQHRAEATLLEACADGDIMMARAAIADGADIDCFDDENSTPLHVASFCGHLALVNLILDASTESLEARGQLEGTPLHVACTGKRHEIVKILLGAKAAVDARDESGLRPLHRAAATGDAPLVSLLLDANAAIDATTDDGSTPLHVASMRSRFDVLELLVSRGASVTAITDGGDSAAELLRRHAPDDAAPARVLALVDDGGFPSPPASPPPPPSDPSPPASPPPLSESSLLSSLPCELLAEVALRASAPEDILLSLGACSREMRDLLDSDETWRVIFSALYEPALQYCFPKWSAHPDECERAEWGRRTWKHFVLRFGQNWLRWAKMYKDERVESGILLVMVHGRVYDVTDFADEHPGDPQLLHAAAGRDATDAFEYVGHSNHANRLLKRYRTPSLEPAFIATVERRRRHNITKEVEDRLRDEEKVRMGSTAWMWPSWPWASRAHGVVRRLHDAYHAWTMRPSQWPIRRGNAESLLGD